MTQEVEDRLNKLAKDCRLKEGTDRISAISKLFVELNKLYSFIDEENNVIAVTKNRRIEHELEKEALGVFFMEYFLEKDSTEENYKLKFDPQIGDFMKYFRFSFAKIKKDLEGEQRYQKYGTIKEDPETGEAKKSRKKINMADTNNYTDAEGHEISAIEHLETERQREILLRTMQALSCFFVSYTKKNNETKQQYFLQFFTETVSYILRTADDSWSVIDGIDRKDELLKVLESKFLDFTLVDHCETLSQIAGSHLKLYGDIIPGKTMLAPPKEDKFGGLPGNIHVVYRKKIKNLPATASTVSENKKAYYELIIRACSSYE